ncbi:MAG: exo-alpha-sialidase [Kiritimatiellae bacterium]|nr:exo-alpha-sialidase [Kiritimatiellia bacterium]
MKSITALTALLLATSVQAAISNVEFKPSGVPAFVGNGEFPIGTLSLISDKGSTLDKVKVNIEGTDKKDLKTLRLGPTMGVTFGNTVTFNVPIRSGNNSYTVYAEVPTTADLTRKLMIEGQPVRLGSIVTRPNQKIVDANRTSKNFRIPGIVETNTGTLVAVFDNRFHHAGDLPADITVGVSISKDKGVTWSPIRTAIDYKNLPGGKGIGDPAILVDPSNNRIWIAALRAPSSGHPIWTSSKGTTSPEDCGQFILAYSDNEGKTWSKPINITEYVKRLQDPDTANWGLLFQGPGAGIAMKNGTLVFPAQVWGHKGGAPHHGVLVYSTDHGATWTSSKAMPWGGSESTVAELPDGSLLLNTREGGGPATRITARTTDLGNTWEKINTDPLRQPGNLCQAAYLALNGKLYFSNPNSGGRNTMTLRVSEDNGVTWPRSVVYDPRPCAGYSSTCPVEGNSIGVIYEGTSDFHYFVRIPEAELAAPETDL